MGGMDRSRARARVHTYTFIYECTGLEIFSIRIIPRVPLRMPGCRQHELLSGSGSPCFKAINYTVRAIS